MRVSSGATHTASPPPREQIRWRVAFLSRYVAGGSGAMLRYMAEGLDPKQYQVSAIFHTIRDPEYAAALEAAGIAVAGLVPPWPWAPPVFSGLNATARLAARPRLREAYQTARATQGALMLDLRWQPALAQQLRRQRPDLVHCNSGLRSHRLDILQCAALGIPVICHMHGFEALTDLERLAARRVWRFIYISRAVAADYARQGIPAEKGVVIPDALPAAALVRAAPLPRAELGSSPEHFVAVNVGRLVPWKGQDVFLRAVARLAPRYPQLRAWLVGAADIDDNGPSRAFAEGLRQLAETLGITDRVVFAGHRTDVPRVMTAADVVVHSASSPEPFGLVLLEAMAASAPLIATGAGGVLDVVEPEVNGLLVPPNDVEAMARAIERLMVDPALRARLAGTGRRFVETHFTVRDQVAQVAALYQQCLEGRDPGAPVRNPGGH